MRIYVSNPFNNEFVPLGPSEYGCKVLNKNNQTMFIDKFEIFNGKHEIVVGHYVEDVSYHPKPKDTYGSTFNTTFNIVFDRDIVYSLIKGYDRRGHHVYTMAKSDNYIESFTCSIFSQYREHTFCGSGCWEGDHISIKATYRIEFSSNLTQPEQ